MIRLVVAPDDSPGARLDSWLAGRTALTRSRIQTLIAASAVTVNGGLATRSHKVRAGESIEIDEDRGPSAGAGGLEPEDIALDILHADADLVVVDKPAGMVVHPAAGHARGTLLNALAHRFGPLLAPGAPLRPGVVQRLDKDTSGVMVVALSGAAYHGLLAQFRDRTIGRVYLALLWGGMPEDRGTIDRPIGRSIGDRKKMSVRTRRGKEAVTSWETVERHTRATLVRIRLGTGRTHQIRVHMAAIGHPVLGDATYGRKTSLRAGGTVLTFPRQMLHAAHLDFIHPVTGERLSFDAPLPPDMRLALDSL
jgi:23S rRNA pseudouridine1911/1915/1917 synthase